MFSTVSRFGQFSKSWRSSPGKSCGDGVGITNATFGGNSRKQRRQFPVRVRYCTKPHTWHRITSRSACMCAARLLSSFSATGLLTDYSGAAKGRNVTIQGKAGTGARVILYRVPNLVKPFLTRSPDFILAPRSRAAQIKRFKSPAPSRVGWRSSFRSASSEKFRLHSLFFRLAPAH